MLCPQPRFSSSHKLRLSVSWTYEPTSENVAHSYQREQLHFERFKIVPETHSHGNSQHKDEASLSRYEENLEPVMGACSCLCDRKPLSFTTLVHFQIMPEPCRKTNSATSDYKIIWRKMNRQRYSLFNALQEWEWSIPPIWVQGQTGLGKKLPLTRSPSFLLLDHIIHPYHACLSSWCFGDGGDVDGGWSCWEGAASVRNGKGSCTGTCLLHGIMFNWTESHSWHAVK